MFDQKFGNQMARFSYEVARPMAWNSAFWVFALILEYVHIFFHPGALIYLNEATLFNNIKVRYNKDKIYASICTFFYLNTMFTLNEPSLARYTQLA